MKLSRHWIWGLIASSALNPCFAANDNSPGNWDFSFSGSHRSRYFSLDHQFRPGRHGSDQAYSMRTLARLQADKGPLSLVAELQDSRTYLNDQGSYLSTSDINALEPLQLYASYAPESNLDLKAGLFTLALGSGRLAGRHGFRNTIQNHAGVQADWQPGPGKTLTMFWVMPVKIRPSDAQGLLDNHAHTDRAKDSLQLAGLFYKTPLASEGMSLETYLFSLQESDKGGSAATADRTLYTPGFRLLKTPAANNWDYELEMAYQWGNRHASTRPDDATSLDVSASFVQAALGYSFDLPWQPHLQVLWIRASGDRDPGDTDYGRFDGLYGPRAEYGPTGIFGMMGRSNMQSAGLRLELEPGSRTEFMVTLRRNRLVSATDSFASTGIRDASGLSGKNAGMQFDFRARHWLKEEILRLEVGGAINFDGDFFRQAPNATREGDPGILYADLSVFF